jgi:type I restriction enzyme S subunit
VPRLLESPTHITVELDGQSVPACSGEDVRTLQLVLPPEQEQRANVEHIVSKTAKLDAVRPATERTINLLKERRSALIAAVVTDQLDLTTEDGTAA